MGLFDFFYGKSLDKEVNKMMSQCDGFLHYAIALSEGAKKRTSSIFARQKRGPRWNYDGV